MVSIYSKKTVAHWVAMNALAETRAGIVLLPTAGAIQRGNTKMLGKDYPWEITTRNLANLPIMKVQVKVFNRHKKVSLDTLQTFVAKPGANYAGN